MGLFTFVLLGLAAEEPFSIDGEAIHPLVVQMFQWGEPAQHSAVLAIDVRRAQENSRRGNLTIDERGWRRTSQTDDDEGRGFFHYRVIGRTSSGTFVLHTADHLGGTAVFHDLLIVAFETGSLIDDSGERTTTLLRSRGRIALGDRFKGSVSLEANQLIVTWGKERKEILLP